MKRKIAELLYALDFTSESIGITRTMTDRWAINDWGVVQQKGTRIRLNPREGIAFVLFALDQCIETKWQILCFDGLSLANCKGRMPIPKRDEYAVLLRDDEVTYTITIGQLSVHARGGYPYGRQ